MLFRSVTDQNGKPVAAALSIALVNEALYAIYPEAVTPIKSFFQSAARRNAEFRLESTSGFAYLGVTRPVVKSIAEEKQRLVERAHEMKQVEALRRSNRYADFSVPSRDAHSLDAGGVGAGGFANQAPAQELAVQDLAQKEENSPVPSAQLEIGRAHV